MMDGVCFYLSLKQYISQKNLALLKLEFVVI